MLVQQFLEDSAGRLPDKVALICDDRRVTYRELNEMANRLANALVVSGIRRGDRVGIFLGNSVEAAAAIFAVLKAGGVFLAINPTTKRDKLSYILRHCGAKVLLADARAVAQGLVPGVLAQSNDLHCAIITGRGAKEACLTTSNCLAFDEIQETFSAVPPPTVNIDLDLACLIYTSGTTGEPKGVMCDHSNVVFASESVIRYLESSQRDVILNFLPLSFGYGLYQLFMTFRVGGTVVLENSFAFPAEILKRIEQEGVNGFPAVPTVFATLLQMDLTQFDLSSLRYVTNAAAALPTRHIQEFRKKLPWVQLYSMYGQTETKRTLYMPPEELDRRPGSVGIAIPGTEVWLEDEQGNRIPPEQTGELVVRGRHVMRGYWGDPKATTQRFAPGPFPGERICRTGDLFRMDAAGYFYFVARKDDIIKCRGEKVAPKEIENVLYGLKGVVEAAVVGVPDATLGQAIKALLVVRGRTLSPIEVRAHCQAHLEDFMIPKYVEFRDQLTKTSSGKISRMALAG